MKSGRKKICFRSTVTIVKGGTRKKSEIQKISQKGAKREREERSETELE